MSKLKDEQLKTWAEEFKTYRDVLDTPGWRMLEGLITAQAEWYRKEMERVIRERTMPRNGILGRLTVEEMAEEVLRLQCHMEEDEIILDMVTNKILHGAAACRVLERRLQTGGILPIPEIKVPEFKEVR